ncbi:hypothetical protein [Pyrobaculum sp.]|uniref:hypothetical protein n=1 Tax=Pyrobaculum sp. TaxID=2004705 RepID=UPI003D0CFD57
MRIAPLDLSDYKYYHKDDIYTTGRLIEEAVYIFSPLLDELVYYSMSVSHSLVLHGGEEDVSSSLAKDWDSTTVSEASDRAGQFYAVSSDIAYPYLTSATSSDLRLKRERGRRSRFEVATSNVVF